MTRTFEVTCPGADGAPELLRRCAALLESTPDSCLVSINVEYGSDTVLKDGLWIEVPDSDQWTALISLDS